MSDSRAEQRLAPYSSRQDLASQAGSARPWLDPWLQMSAQGVCFIDAQGQVREANPALCSLFGRPRAELVGLAAHGLCGGAELPGPGGASSSLEIGIDRSDGKRVNCLIHLTPLRDALGKALGTVAVWTDVTAQRQAKPSAHGAAQLSPRPVEKDDLMLSLEGELLALLDAFPGFIARANADFRYEYVNERFAALFGLAPAQMIGHEQREYLEPAHFEDMVRRRERVLATGQPQTFERSLHSRSSGERVELLLTTFTVKPRHPSGQPHFYQVGIDITARKRSEHELQVTGEQLQLTLDSIAQGIICIEADGKIGTHNRRVHELLELPQSLFGPSTHYDDVLDFQTRRGDLAGDPRFHSGSGEPRNFVTVRRDSPEVYVRRTRSGVLLEIRTRHLPTGAMVRTYSDVTAYLEAQQALQEREAELRALLEAFPGYIAALDQDYRYTYVNSRIEAFLGRPASVLIGSSPREILGEERFRENEHQIQRAIAGELAVIERCYFGGAGRQRLDLELTHVAGPLRPGGRRNFYAFGIDITTRKQAEEALMLARDEAERANRAKSQFLSHMSHELRTPLNAILGFGELLAIDTREPLTERQLPQVQAIINSGEHLLSLVNEVLDLARLEAGSLPLERVPVGLHALVEECVDMVRPSAQAHQIQLHSPVQGERGLQAWADRLRLKQVLLNLLTNAINYNQPGGEVSVSCEASNGSVQLVVRDNGKGISDEEQKLLFLPFERLSATHTAVEGAGIGLALSQRLVRAMAGSIDVQSKLGSGSTFRVQLPRAPVQLL